jgi:hypothetical protein
MLAASGRPTRSATPPGGNGTIIVTGLTGYMSWAIEAHVHRPNARNRAMRDTGLLRTALINMRLQMLHFLGSLFGRLRVK